MVVVRMGSVASCSKSSSSLPFVLTISWLLLVVVYYNKFLAFEIRTNSPSNGADLDKVLERSNYTRKASDVVAITLLPGELPGYSGWYRPSTSLAGYFSIVGVDDGLAQLGSNWTVRVECHHPEGRLGGSLFYVRAYGPSILPGVVTDHRNGTYDMTILPFDAGIFQLEVVLAFSKAPPWRDMPHEDEAAYEGYLLPGFPREIIIPYPYYNRSRYEDPHERTCQMSDLLETSPRSAIERGRWLVTKKMMQEQYDPNVTYQIGSIHGYKSGANSIGFQADYFPTDCSLLSPHQLSDPMTVIHLMESTNMPNNPIQILFIGDSNMRIQREHFDTYFGETLRTEFIDNSGGILPTLPAIKQRLQELEKEEAIYFVIFNTGLHDIYQLCFHANAIGRMEYIQVPDKNFSCFEQYGKSMEEFVDVVMSFPSALTVWQTTSAGWPKWGVFGAAWGPATRQMFPLCPNTVEELNNIAWEILERKGVPIVDSYWMSLSRPDNREIAANNELSRHLVHPGLEVLSVATRKWATMILEVIRDWRE